MRAPDGDAQERRQAQAQRRAEAVGEAGWGAEAQRDGLRYRERQRWSESGKRERRHLVVFTLKNKENQPDA